MSGKLIRHSLDTHVLEVAKPRPSYFLKDYRRVSKNKVGTVKGEVIIEQYRNQLAAKLYKEENLIALRKTWPDLFDTDIAR